VGRVVTARTADRVMGALLLVLAFLVMLLAVVITDAGAMP
jgi:hypothetical protein